MTLRLVFVIFLAQCFKCLALCSYEKYEADDRILVADENCKAMRVCSVDNTCKARYISQTSNTTSFSNVWAIGNMRDYNMSELEITDTPSTTLKSMVLPPIVNLLSFEKVLAIDLTSASVDSWPNVTTLFIEYCKNLVITNKIQWPPNLKSIVLKETNLNNVPQGLPKNLEELAIQFNGLTDLMYLPQDNITFLNFYGNSLKEVTNKIWDDLTYLCLGNNPLETFAFVRLSTKIVYFDITLTNLTNITIDTATAAALNALGPWDGNDDNSIGFAIDRNISTDASACSDIGGTIQSLFQSQKNLSVTACVLSNSSTPSPTIGTTSSNTNGGTIVIVILGIIAVIAIGIAAFIFIRSKRRLSMLALSKKKEGKAKSSNEGETSTQSSGNNHESGGRIASQLDQEVVDLDVSLLRYHRLELSDLIVLGNKPLASGAYGEVWRGTYGSQQVAIKRIKNKQPRQVQKFIDEIILMSQLDCDYIVKFIGASWTKPIEIECVVEFMDLGDLRGYLVNHSPADFTWDQKFTSIVSIARGLLYLHTFTPPIIHRDLKSRNVLMDSKSGTKLTDFGTSRVAEENDLMTSGIGTYQWMAPEVVSGTHYSSPADIYSFGIILSEFCTHQVPYTNVRHPKTGKLLAQHSLLQEVKAGHVHPSFDGENVPSWVKDVGMQCIQLNENDRPTALQLCVMLATADKAST